MAAIAHTLPIPGSCAGSESGAVQASRPPASNRAAQAGSRSGSRSGSLSDAQLARLAVEALIDEAQLTPKPALVDRRGSGAHRDLDLAKMIRSAHALEATFVALARTARAQIPSATLRAELAQIGRSGENAMMQATDGSNAHRGAIWIVGLLVAGAAICDTPWPGPDRLPAAPALRICQTAARIACFPDRFAAPANSNGERVRRRYRVGGARLEAQEGFPHVVDTGLPALASAREKGIAEDAARIDTLLAIMASLDDTCLLHRAGLAGLRAGQHGARRVLERGGMSSAPGRSEFAILESELMSLNASPGGAADLLAATLFIDKLAVHHASRSAA